MPLLSRHAAASTRPLEYSTAEGRIAVSFLLPSPSASSIHKSLIYKLVVIYNHQQFEMASLQIARSGFSPTIHLRPNLPVRRRIVAPLAFPVLSRLQKGNGDSTGEEPPESLFMKELKRRGVTPSSLLEDAERAFYRQGQEDVVAEEENGGGTGRGRSKRNGVASAEYEKGASRQRQLSMALNSEGIEGLIPRAKLLLTIGGTFFLGFWPLILITFSAFAALYFYFGPTFVHDASKISATPPPYIEPYELLKDERISQVPPILK